MYELASPDEADEDPAPEFDGGIACVVIAPFEFTSPAGPTSFTTNSIFSTPTLHHEDYTHSSYSTLTTALILGTSIVDPYVTPPKYDMQALPTYDSTQISSYSSLDGALGTT